MIRQTHRTAGRARLAGLVGIALLTTATILPVTSVAAAEPADPVLTWNAHAIAAISNPPPANPPVAGAVPGLGQPPPLSPIHLAMVHGAIYDAVNAIHRGYEPYLGGLPRAPRWASKAAAVATAARDVLIALPPGSAAVTLSVNTIYDTFMAPITAGPAKDAGIAIGAAAAAAMIAERTGDGRFGTHTFTPGTPASPPGVWQLVPPANANVFGWVAKTDPFTMKSTDQFRTKGPLDITSRKYAREFDEVKALGRQTGSSRTPEQQLLAGFISANPVPMMNRALREIAVAKGLSTTQQARLFVMTSMGAADALIGCWDDKDHYSIWRPQTAIRAAATDGNPWTSPDPDWLSLFPTPGYPDHPSGYNCLTAGTWYSARHFFGTDRMSFSLTSPGVAQALPNTPIGVPGSTRTYTRFSQVVDDAINGRILNGFHFRTADEQGAGIGKNVAKWIDKHFFEREHRSKH